MIFPILSKPMIFPHAFPMGFPMPQPWPWPRGIPLRRLELCGCRVGATGAQRLAEALRNPQGGASMAGRMAGRMDGGWKIPWENMEKTIGGSPPHDL